MCTQQYAIEVLKSVLIPFLGNLDKIVVCCSQRYFLDYCHCSISSSSIGNNNKNATFIRTTRWCVCIPYDACKCIALRCIHAPFNIFYIFIWCVYQNQRQSHLMEYWILSKVQFVHLCACKRNYFDESFRVSHERTRERWNGTADNIWSNAYVERYILHIAHCSLHHDTQIQTCIYSFRKYARDKWCSFIQMLARSIQYSCMPNALTLRSKLLVGIYRFRCTQKGPTEIVLIRIFYWTFFVYEERCFANWCLNRLALHFTNSASKMCNAFI